MKNSKNTGSREPEKVRKPFMTGSPADENTVRTSLRFLGILVLMIFVSFITCSSVSAAGAVIRIPFNIAVILLVLFIMFNNGSNHGSDAVARGEIIYQKNQDGKPYSESEKKICFHPLKGYITGLLGTLPLFLVAVIFAFSTTIVLTGAGTLPSWMQAYTRRSDISDALVNYLQPEGMSLTDYLRIVIRICILPFVNLIGTQNPRSLLILEKLSPVILLLPAVSYGTGYLYGPQNMTKVHTMISENSRRMKKKEMSARKKRSLRSSGSGPEQLN